MVQISKLTKTEIKETGFNNRSIAAKFMKGAIPVDSLGEIFGKPIPRKAEF